MPAPIIIRRAAKASISKPVGPSNIIETYSGSWVESDYVCTFLYANLKDAVGAIILLQKS